MSDITKRAGLVLRSNKLLVFSIASLLLVAFILLYLAGLPSFTNHAPHLHSAAQLLVSVLVVPLVLKLWFWSGIHSSLLDTLAIHRTLHDLGLLAIHPSREYEWSDILSAERGARFVLIALAGQPLATEALRQRLIDISKVPDATITICIRHPSEFDSSFAPALLTGQVDWLKEFVRNTLAKAKHSTCQIRFGWVSFELKYTLILGSGRGVYVPHPADQQHDKSTTLIRLAFDCHGQLFKRFIEPDVEFILAQMKTFP